MFPLCSLAARLRKDEAARGWCRQAVLSWAIRISRSVEMRVTRRSK